MPIDKHLISNMMSIQTIQESLTPIFQQYPISKVYLFGSYAKGHATEKSDIDLAVDMHSPDDPLLILDLYADCQDALSKEFDIFEVSAFRTDSYLEGAHVIYER